MRIISIETSYNENNNNCNFGFAYLGPHFVAIY